MSEKETYSSRELLRQHAEKSAQFQSDMRVYMAKSDEMWKNMIEKTNKHEDSIIHLDRAHNRQKGAMYAIGSVGSVGLIHAVKTWLGL